MRYKYFLASLWGVGSRKKKQLWNLFADGERIYRLEAKQLQSFMTQKEVERWMKQKAEWDLEKSLQLAWNKQVKITIYDETDYPENLKCLADAPFALFYRGTLPQKGENMIAVVGARDCSGYGQKVAQDWGRAFAQAGVSVVSGMAAGIDGVAQRAAIKEGGKSYAVLGCGVDICYPRENERLYEELPQRGALLSEYPLGMPPQAKLFPPRNRLISGLSRAVVVVEARKKSGTLITVDFALAQGRDVFAVPGRVTDSLSEGCNALLAQGAIPAVSIDEVLEYVGIMFEQKDSILDWEPELEEEKRIFRQLESNPKNIAQIMDEIEADGFTVGQIMGILLRLMAKGVVREMAGGYVR